MLTIIITMLAGFMFALKYPSSKLGVRVTAAIKAKTGKRRARPLDCEACLSFWSTLVFSLFFKGLLFSFVAAVIVFFAMAKYQEYKIKNS